jgi:hypothetical protein
MPSFSSSRDETTGDQMITGRPLARTFDRFLETEIMIVIIHYGQSQASSRANAQQRVAPQPPA